MKALSSTLALAGALVAANAEAGSVLHVPADFPTIQSAIVASFDGDTVLVSPGTYFELIDFLDRDIAVLSTDGPEVTVIDGTFLGSVVQMHSTATRATRLDGFTITHGLGDFFAGGIFASGGSPVISGNIVTENHGSGQGNGISVYFSSALVTGNHIVGNSNGSGSSGGGGGGGMSVGGDPCPGSDCGTEVSDNVIEDNTTNAFTSGGGIYLNAAGRVTIVGNIIRNNSAPDEGGGIAMFNGSSPRIENNLIVGNHVLASSGEGGGIYWLTPSGERGPFVIGNTIVNNQAGHGSGVYADGFDISARLINNMIVGPAGFTGVECGTFNDPFPPVVRDNDVYVVGASAFAGLCAGDGGVAGNIMAAPVFLGAGDYRLAPSSPGIDAGENVFTTETLDLRGFRRIVDGNRDHNAIVDMGAYERANVTTSPPPAAARR